MKYLNNLKFYILFVLFLTIMSLNSSAFFTVSVYQQVCNADGALIITPISGLPPYTFTYYGNGLPGVTHTFTGSSDTIFNLIGGNYIITYVNLSVVQTLFLPQPLQVGVTVVPDTCPLNTGSITLNVSGGTGPYSYSWLQNGVPIGVYTNYLSGVNGYFDCFIQVAGGCSINLNHVDSNHIVSSISNVSSQFVATQPNCTNGNIKAIPSGGASPFTFLWSNGATTDSIYGLNQGYYSITVTDASGCIGNGYYLLNNLTNLTVSLFTNPAICSSSNGSLSSTTSFGFPPYSYLWSTGQTTSSISGVPTGNYYLNVIDSKGCNGFKSAYVNSLSPISLTYTSNPTSCTTPNGDATIVINGGAFPYNIVWNTSPVQTTITATGLDAGNYNVFVSDVNNCTAAAVVTVAYATNLNMSLTATPELCLTANGTAQQISSGGTLPYSYIWSNGQTIDSISNLSTGLYWATVNDAAGCHITKCVFVENKSTVSGYCTTKAASCINVADGEATAYAFAGQPPYSYFWSDGQTTQTAVNLLPKIYAVTIIDAIGCELTLYLTVSYNYWQCYTRIEGYVYNDVNNNCIKDLGEPGYLNAKVLNITTGEIKLTEFSGYYKFDVFPGNYLLQHYPINYRIEKCPVGQVSINVPTVGLTINQNFADSDLVTNDLETHIINLSQPVVGNSQKQLLLIKNIGTVASTPYTFFDYSILANFQSANLAPFNVNIPQHYAEFNLPLLSPLKDYSLITQKLIPTNVPLSTTIVSYDSVAPYLTDTTPFSNTEYNFDVTVSSYDPNYKEVSPKGVGPLGIISNNDSVLNYVVHFENTGNYHTQKIIIIDTLDSNLDRMTFQSISSPVPSNISISPANVLTYEIFYALPPITLDTINCKSFIAYSIKLKPNLAPLTEIKNTAHIFFDYNPAIVTNTTLNIIGATTVNEINNSEFDFNLFPNPVSDVVYIRFNKPQKTIPEIELIDVLGKKVNSIKLTKTNSDYLFNVKNLKNGFYVIRINNQTKRLLIF